MQKKDTIKIAAAQTSPIFLNKDKSIDKACKLIREASENGSRLIVFPEAFIAGYPDWVWLVPNSNTHLLNELYLELVKNALTIPDKMTDKLCKTARQAKINVVIGLNERNSESSNSSLFNTILFISEKGEILGKHRKLIPTGGERLIWAQGKGDTLNVYQTSAGQIGGLICWENYMPLARQAIYNLGAQVLVAPTWDKSEKWLLSLRHIAREGGLFVIGSCMGLKVNDIPDRYEFKKLYPENREWVNVGNSCIIGPGGDFITGPIEKKKTILYAKIDLNEVIKAKRIFDVAGHYSRPDVFNLKIKIPAPFQ